MGWSTTIQLRKISGVYRYTLQKNKGNLRATAFIHAKPQKKKWGGYGYTKKTSIYTGLYGYTDNSRKIKKKNTVKNRTPKKPPKNSAVQVAFCFFRCRIAQTTEIIETRLAHLSFYDQVNFHRKNTAKKKHPIFRGCFKSTVKKGCLSVELTYTVKIRKTRKITCLLHFTVNLRYSIFGHFFDPLNYRCARDLTDFFHTRVKKGSRNPLNSRSGKSTLEFLRKIVKNRPKNDLYFLSSFLFLYFRQRRENAPKKTDTGKLLMEMSCFTDGHLKMHRIFLKKWQTCGQK